MRTPLPPPAVRASLAATLISVVVGFLMLIATPTPASAHAVLLDTTPGTWQVLDDSPKSVSLRFNEAVDVGLAEIRLISPRGEEISGLGRPVHPGGRADTIAVGLPQALANGTHTVTFRVTSADAHPASGAFTFSVRQIGGSAGAAAAEPATADGLVGAVYGIARWAGFAGLAAMLGGVFFVVTCWPGGARLAGTRRWVFGGAGTLAAASGVSLLVYGPYVAGRGMGAVADLGVLGATLGSRFGLVLLVRLAVLAGLVVAARSLLRAPRPGPATAAAVLTGGGVLAATWGLVNHSASGGLVALSVAVDTVHLVAMGVWLGGLGILLGVLLPARDVSAMRVAIPRFSRVALVCVATLVASGTYQAWRQVGTPAALFGTDYGTFLLAKLGLVAVLLALGATARAWVRRQYAFDVATITDKRRARRGPEVAQLRRFRRVVTAEAGLAAAVLALTAALVAVEPARAEVARENGTGAAAARGGPQTVAVPFDAGTGPSGRGTLAVSVAPGKVGRNEIHLVVLDSEGRPKEVPEVGARLAMPSAEVAPIPLRLTYLGAAHYATRDAALSMPGTWELVVTVRATDVDQDVLRIPVGAG